jgi:hypothetical protein
MSREREREGGRERLKAQKNSENWDEGDAPISKFTHTRFNIFFLEKAKSSQERMNVPKQQRQQQLIVPKHPRAS